MAHSKEMNRLKVVPAEKKRTNKWPAEQPGRGSASIFRWCATTAQPHLEHLIERAKCLDVEAGELVRQE